MNRIKKGTKFQLNEREYLIGLSSETYLNGVIDYLKNDKQAYKIMAPATVSLYPAEHEAHTHNFLTCDCMAERLNVLDVLRALDAIPAAE